MILQVHGNPHPVASTVESDTVYRALVENVVKCFLIILVIMFGEMFHQDFDYISPVETFLDRKGATG